MAAESYVVNTVDWDFISEWQDVVGRQLLVLYFLFRRVNHKQRQLNGRQNAAKKVWNLKEMFRVIWTVSGFNDEPTWMKLSSIKYP